VGASGDLGSQRSLNRLGVTVVRCSDQAPDGLVLEVQLGHAWLQPLTVAAGLDLLEPFAQRHGITGASARITTGALPQQRLNLGRHVDLAEGVVQLRVVGENAAGQARHCGRGEAPDVPAGAAHPVQFGRGVRAGDELGNSRLSEVAAYLADTEIG
jgi:hypothetical protein